MFAENLAPILILVTVLMVGIAVVSALWELIVMVFVGGAVLGVPTFGGVVFAHWLYGSPAEINWLAYPLLYGLVPVGMGAVGVAIAGAGMAAARSKFEDIAVMGTIAMGICCLIGLLFAVAALWNGMLVWIWGAEALTAGFSFLTGVAGAWAVFAVAVVWHETVTRLEKRRQRDGARTERA